MKKTLKQQLADVVKLKASFEKKEADLCKKIEAEKNKNKPKSIFYRVKTFKDVIAITKPSKEVISLINYSGKDELMIHSKFEMRCVLIAKALNEGWIPKMNGSMNRYYAWFYISSGFVFNDSDFGDTGAYAASASRLCFETPEKAKYAATQFPSEYEVFIMK
jgi:hypothetical protein